MKIRTIKTLSNRIYSVSIETSDFSQDEINRMVNYGEPELNIGGTVGAATYPDDLRLLKSDSPFPFSADGRDYTTDAEAEAAADAWAVEIISRIKTLMDALRALGDTFTEESVETY